MVSNINSIACKDLLDLVRGVSRVIHNTVDLLVRRSIDIGKQPVAQDISLHPPGEGKSAIGLDEVHELGLRVLDRARGTLEGESLLALSALCSSFSSLNGKLEDIAGGLECVHGIREVTLHERVCRNLASEERVSVREDRSIFGNLGP